MLFLQEPESILEHWLKNKGRRTEKTNTRYAICYQLAVKLFLKEGRMSRTKRRPSGGPYERIGLLLISPLRSWYTNIRLYSMSAYKNSFSPIARTRFETPGLTAAASFSSRIPARTSSTYYNRDLIWSRTYRVCLTEARRPRWPHLANGSQQQPRARIRFPSSNSIAVSKMPNNSGRA